MRRKIFIAVVLVVIISSAFVLAVWFDAFTPAAPAGWSQVHAGMSRDAVLRLTGTPTFSGWPEKVAETWEIRGAICNRRLFIYYRSEQRDVGYVQDMCEGTWLRGHGWLHPRKEPM